MLCDLIIFLFAGWPKVRSERESKENRSEKSITIYNIFLSLTIPLWNLLHSCFVFVLLISHTHVPSNLKQTWFHLWTHHMVRWAFVHVLKGARQNLPQSWPCHVARVQGVCQTTRQPWCSEQFHLWILKLSRREGQEMRREEEGKCAEARLICSTCEGKIKDTKKWEINNRG